MLGKQVPFYALLKDLENSRPHHQPYKDIYFNPVLAGRCIAIVDHGPHFELTLASL